MPDDPRRKNITRGIKMIGATFPADDPRRARIQKGVFLTSTPSVKGAAPADFTDAILEMADRLRTVRARLEAPRKR